METEDNIDYRTKKVSTYIQGIKDSMVYDFNAGNFDNVIETAKKSIETLRGEYNNVNFEWKGKIPIAIDALLDCITMAKSEKNKVLTKEKTVV